MSTSAPLVRKNHSDTPTMVHNRMVLKMRLPIGEGSGARNCHSERSEESNSATACEHCAGWQARLRLIFAALRMTGGLRTGSRRVSLRRRRFQLLARQSEPPLASVIIRDRRREVRFREI